MYAFGPRIGVRVDRVQNFRSVDRDRQNVVTRFDEAMFGHGNAKT